MTFWETVCFWKKSKKPEDAKTSNQKEEDSERNPEDYLEDVVSVSDVLRAEATLYRSFPEFFDEWLFSYTEAMTLLVCTYYQIEEKYTPSILMDLNQELRAVFGKSLRCRVQEDSCPADDVIDCFKDLVEEFGEELDAEEVKLSLKYHLTSSYFMEYIMACVLENEYAPSDE
jgi:hypothetical protein